MSAAHLHRRFDRPDSYQIAIEKKTFDGRYSASSVIVTLSIALGLYNCIEMALLIFTTFKKWKGLYFWSLSLCTTGVVLYSLGMMFTYFDLCVLWFGKTILDIGWVLMVICQSLVLYSRLNLILESILLLNLIKWYIMIDSTLLATTTIVLDYGTTYGATPRWAAGYFYIEHVQMTGFTLQEVIVSGVYVWKTIMLLRILQKPNTRTLIWQLLIINVVIIAMDIALIVLQFKHLQLYQESIKAFVYSVKLKLELNILSRLVDLVHGPSVKDRSMTLATLESNTIYGQVLVNDGQDMTRPNFITSWAGGGDREPDGRKQFKRSRDSQDSHSDEPDLSPSTSRQQPIHHTDVLRRPSMASARMNGRETDMLYADVLRSISD